MRVQQRIVGDIFIVEIIGQILGGGGDVRLKEMISSVKEQGYTRVVVDLGNVTYIDIAGLGGLVRAYATTAKAGGTLKLMRPTTRLRHLLTITKLVAVFDIYDDEHAALASFAAAA